MTAGALRLLGLLLFGLAFVAGCGDSAAEDEIPFEEQEPTRPIDRYAQAETAIPEEFRPERRTRFGGEVDEALLAPHLARDRAPEVFRVRLELPTGALLIECVREWAPLGVDRFYNLVKRGYYDQQTLYRVDSSSHLAFGVHDDPGVNRAWRASGLTDEPARQKNRRGYVALIPVEGRPNSRRTDIVLLLADRPELDASTAPIGHVIEGLSLTSDLKQVGSELHVDTLRRQGKSYLLKAGLLNEVEELGAVSVVEDAAGGAEASSGTAER